MDGTTMNVYAEADATFRLMDACTAAFDKVLNGNPPKYKPQNGVTWCNRAVSEICFVMGYNGFEGMLANQMIDKMEKDIPWNRLGPLEAQGHANSGYLVIAGKKQDPHGHVVVIRPGNMEYSQKWGKDVPKCVNIGAETTIGRGVNWAFKEEPRYYLWMKSRRV